MATEEEQREHVAAQLAQLANALVGSERKRGRLRVV